MKEIYIFRDLKIKIGENIKKERKRLVLNQKGLAKKTGITQRTVSSLENGKANVGLNCIYNISIALGVNCIKLISSSSKYIEANEGLSEFKKKIGKRIQKKRMLMKLTQNQLAEKIGINQRFISQIENGQINASMEYIFNISIVLDLSYVELFEARKTQ
jgi:transcriptional regulator with XRE-family HTH domain